MFIEFLVGSLPWSKMKDRESVGRMKVDSSETSRPIDTLYIPRKPMITHVSSPTYPMNSTNSSNTSTSCTMNIRLITNFSGRS